MLIEVKVKVALTVGSKVQKKTKTYVIDKAFFSEAKYAVTAILDKMKNDGEVDTFDIVSIRASAIKEIISTYKGEHSYISTMKDTFTDEKGNEKPFKYKVLLWADTFSEAAKNTTEIAQQGYNMSIEGTKEVDYIYLKAQAENWINGEETAK